MEIRQNMESEERGYRYRAEDQDDRGMKRRGIKRMIAEP